MLAEGAIFYKFALIQIRKLTIPVAGALPAAGAFSRQKGVKPSNLRFRSKTSKRSFFSHEKKIP